MAAVQQYPRKKSLRRRSQTTLTRLGRRGSVESTCLVSGHVTKGKYHVKCLQWGGGGRGQNWVNLVRVECPPKLSDVGQELKDTHFLIKAVFC